MKRFDKLKALLVLVSIVLIVAGCGERQRAPSDGAATDPERALQLNEQVIKLLQQGKYTEAVPIAKEALDIREKALGPDHPDVAASLNNLGELYRKSGREKEAEALEKRAAAIEAIKR